MGCHVIFSIAGSAQVGALPSAKVELGAGVRTFAFGEGWGDGSLVPLWRTPSSLTTSAHVPEVPALFLELLPCPGPPELGCWVLGRAGLTFE